ncbi:MAG: 16S rRNA processing protein RimM [Spirochaetales bacterium]|nr:16S rRNA processing protein RimM [Spirochaetales bacterium]
MNNKIKVGFIRKAHGLKGEVKILPLTDDPKRFKKIKKLFLRKPDEVESLLAEYDVESVRFSAEEVILKFKEICDKDAADFLRGTSVYINRSDAVPLDEWEFFSQDLIGLSVFYKEENVGTVTDVLNTGANDNLEILLNDNSKHIYYPFIRTFINNVDLENGCLIINQYEGFFD